MSRARAAVNMLLFMKLNVAGYFTPTSAEMTVHSGNRFANASLNLLKADLGAAFSEEALTTTAPRLVEDETSILLRVTTRRVDVILGRPMWLATPKEEETEEDEDENALTVREKPTIFFVAVALDEATCRVLEDAIENLEPASAGAAKLAARTGITALSARVSIE